MSDLRDHSPLVIDEFNGFWKRGDEDSVPLDHFSDVNNIAFIESGFKTRDGLDTFLAKGNVLRIYTFNTELDGLLILDTNSDIYHIIGSGTHIDSITLILHVAGMTDFKFININNRAYITPIGVNDFIYVYNGGTTAARKAAGHSPVNAEGALAVTESGTGNIEAGIHIFGVVYETNSGFLTKIGPDSLAVLTASGGKSANLSNIAISPSSFIVARHIVATRAIDPGTYTGNTRGYDFFFVPGGKINNNTSTTLTVSFFDADLLDPASQLLDLLTEIPNCNDLNLYGNRMIASGFGSPDLALVRVSNPGEPEAFSAIDGLIELPNDGLGIQNTFIYRNVLYICKFNQTTATNDNGDVPSSWQLVVLDQAIGAFLHTIGYMNERTAGPTIEYILIADNTGIYLFNGTFIKPELSYKIKDFWLSLPFLEFETFEFYIDTLHQIIYINLPFMKMIFIGDYTNGLDPFKIRWSKWTFDVEPTSITLFNKDNNLILASKAGTIITTYTLSVTSGTGDGNYAAGTVVTIVADPPPTGQLFANWTGGIVANAALATTTIIMPASDVSLFANYYTPLPTQYTLNVVSGTGDGVYISGTVVIIIADVAPTGKQFYAWTGATVANAFASTTTITLLANSTVSATYIDIVVIDASLVVATDFQYQGSFRVPNFPSNNTTFSYSPGVFGYCTEHNSLYGAGYNALQWICEISIPTTDPTITDYNSLPMATYLQPFQDAAGGHINDIGTSGAAYIGGILPYNGKLYFDSYLFYDAGSPKQDLSHFVCNLDFSNPHGPFKVGTFPNNAGVVDGYMGLIPASRQSQLGGTVLTGQAGIPIVERTSLGPGVTAVTMENLGTVIPLPTVTLLQYPLDHPLFPAYNQGDQSDLWNGASNVGGVLLPINTRSVLFFGKQGIGPYCYGEGSDCGDAADASKGTHAYPYFAQVWAYDINDLVNVKNGTVATWAVQPYAFWHLPIKFGTLDQRITSSAYDPATGRIFIAHDTYDNGLPVIDVFKILNH